MHIGVPADEIKVLDETNHLDRHLIKQRYRVARLNIKECCNHAAYVGANHHDAVYACDFAESFNRSFQYFMVRLDEVKLAFILGNLLGFVIRFNFSNVALTKEAQDGNQTSLKFSESRLEC
jgi:hypothetical protein